MKLKLFEFAILMHPELDKDGKEVGKTVFLKELCSMLAKDEKQVGIVAAKSIPEAHMDSLDRVEIVVRPF